MTLIPPSTKKMVCNGCGFPALPQDLRAFVRWLNGAIVVKHECWRCRKREAQRKEVMAHGA